MSRFSLLSFVFVTLWVWNSNVPSAFGTDLKQTQTNSTLFIFKVLHQDSQMPFNSHFKTRSQELFPFDQDIKSNSLSLSQHKRRDM